MIAQSLIMNKGNMNIMKNVFLYLPIAFILLSTLGLADTNITTCQNLNTAGETYYLTQDIIDYVTFDQCFDVTAQNITLDCLGHTVDGQINKAMRIQNLYNITVKNCIINDWEFGIDFTQSATSYIINSTLSDMDNYAIAINSIKGDIYVINTTISYGALYGIEIHDLNYNGDYKLYIYDSKIEKFDYAIWISGMSTQSFCGEIINTEIKESGNAIFSMSNTELCNDSIGIKIYNNIFNGTLGGIAENRKLDWNITQQTGNRIYTDGIEIGGNYWCNSSNTGYSQICNDTDTDGFCDEPYIINSNNTDYLPLSENFIPTTTTTTIIPEEKTLSEYPSGIIMLIGGLFVLTASLIIGLRFLYEGLFLAGFMIIIFGLIVVIVIAGFASSVV